MSTLTENRATQWFSKYGLIVLGFGFGFWSAYNAFRYGGAHNIAGFMMGFMCAITQADRNVYYERLYNVGETLNEHDGFDLTLRRVNWTDYEVIESESEELSE